MNDQLPITHHSGTLRTVTLAGESYNVAHLYCACAGATIEAALHKHDPQDTVSVKIHCPKHGMLNAAAIKCGLTFSCEPVTNATIFAIVEERHAKDRRVAWGMKLPSGRTS